jgi:hypothetical protein
MRLGPREINHACEQAQQPDSARVPGRVADVALLSRTGMQAAARFLRPRRPPPRPPQMCILSGCDFLAGLQGIGVRKAHGYVRKYKGFVKVCGQGLSWGVPCAQTPRPAASPLLWRPPLRPRAPRGGNAQAPTPARPLQTPPAGQGPALQRRAHPPGLRGRVPARALGLPPLSRVLPRRAHHGAPHAAAGGRHRRGRRGRAGGGAGGGGGARGARVPGAGAAR